MTVTHPGLGLEAHVDAIAHAGPGTYRLTITWRIHDPANKPAWVAVTTPVSVATADPIILDHTSPLGPVPVSPNVAPRLRIVAIPPGATVEETITYAVAVTAPSTLTAVGRFGTFDAPPDPQWEALQNWKQASAHWRVIDSRPFTLTFPP